MPSALALPWEDVLPTQGSKIFTTPGSSMIFPVSARWPGERPLSGGCYLRELQLGCECQRVPGEKCPLFVVFFLRVT